MGEVNEGCEWIIQTHTKSEEVGGLTDMLRALPTEAYAYLQGIVVLVFGAFQSFFITIE